MELVVVEQELNLRVIRPYTDKVAELYNPQRCFSPSVLDVPKPCEENLAHRLL